MYTAIILLFVLMFLSLLVCFKRGYHKRDILTPDQFTKEYINMLQTALPGVRIVLIKDLELAATPPGGSKSTCFLYNAYEMYKQKPSAKKETIQKYVTALLEAVKENAKTDVDTTRIVPIIKDRPWLDEMRMTILRSGGKDVDDRVYEEFNSDLMIVYAEDSPKNIHYLTSKDLEAAKIERATLRTLACENLRKLLPPVKRHGNQGIYMITAGGDYEASLLLLEEVWKPIASEVKGELVVAIPNRDMLLITGSGNPSNIAKLGEIANKAYASGSYRLTTKLFIVRDGKFVEYSE